eukprot:6661930-Prymnesium_polylepis.1
MNEACRGYGLWLLVRRKAVLERYAALRCLWHERADPSAPVSSRRWFECLRVVVGVLGGPVRRCGGRVRRNERVVVRCGRRARRERARAGRGRRAAGGEGEREREVLGGASSVTTHTHDSPNPAVRYGDAAIDACAHGHRHTLVLAAWHHAAIAAYLRGGSDSPRAARLQLNAEFSPGYRPDLAVEGGGRCCCSTPRSARPTLPRSPSRSAAAPRTWRLAARRSD